jgi:hypothetical protein
MRQSSAGAPVYLKAVIACVLAASASAYAAGPRLIVQFRDDDVEAAFSPVTRVAHLARESGVEGRHLRRMASGAHLVELGAGADATAAAKAAMTRGGAKIAVPDRRLKRAVIPNDVFVRPVFFVTFARSKSQPSEENPSVSSLIFCHCSSGFSSTSPRTKT